MILIFLLNFIVFLFQSSTRNNTIQNQLNQTQNFSGIPWKEDKKGSRNYILNSMCYTKVHHLNIIQSGAWNDNYVNKITLNDNTKCRSVINLII